MYLVSAQYPAHTRHTEAVDYEYQADGVMLVLKLPGGGEKHIYVPSTEEIIFEELERTEG